MRVRHTGGITAHHRFSGLLARIVGSELGPVVGIWARIVGPSASGLVALAMPLILLSTMTADEGLGNAPVRERSTSRELESTVFGSPWVSTTRDLSGNRDEIRREALKETRSPYEVLMPDIYDPKAMKPNSEEEKAIFTLARYLRSKKAP